MVNLAVAGLLAAVLSGSAASAQSLERDLYDVDVFARIGDPGLPEGIAVAEDGTVFVGTNPGGNAPGPQSGQRSKIFAFDPDGTLLRSYSVGGQDLTSVALPAYGLQALAFDGSGLLYAVDKAPARILTIDPATGEQSDYATFPDVPPCSTSPADGQCSDTVSDLRAFPNYLAFAPDGDLYVSDFQQALIWRVPPGGGVAEVFLTDVRLEGGNGANGLQFMADGRTLVVAQSLLAADAVPGTGRLYTLEVGDDGPTEALDTLYTSRPADGPDGFAIGASGRIYLNLFLANQVVVIEPDGTEAARIPQTPADNLLLEIPFDSPASSAFLGERLLVTNHAVNTRNPLSFAVLDVNAGEPGLPLFRPTLPAPAPGPGPGPGPDGTDGGTEPDPGTAPSAAQAAAAATPITASAEFTG